MDYKMSHGGGYIVYKSDGTVANAQNLFDRLAALEKVAEAAKRWREEQRRFADEEGGSIADYNALIRDFWEQVDTLTALAETEKPKP
jgi:hypothetical protein